MGAEVGRPEPDGQGASVATSGKRNECTSMKVYDETLLLAGDYATREG